MMENILKQEVIEAVSKCTDLELLDFIYRLVAYTNKPSGRNSERES